MSEQEPEPEQETQAKSNRLLPGGGWQKHALAIILYVSIMTPVTWWFKMLSPEHSAFVDSLTNTTNIMAICYSVFVYYLFDTSRKHAIRQAQEKGIDVPSMDVALGMVYTKLKKFDTWFDANREELHEIENKLRQVNLSQMLNSLEELSKISGAIKDSGMSTEDMAEFLHYMPKAMERLKEFIDEEETKLADIPDHVLGTGERRP